MMDNAGLKKLPENFKCTKNHIAKLHQWKSCAWNKTKQESELAPGLT